MPKITRSALIYVLAFFIFAGLSGRPLNAQDINVTGEVSLSNAVRTLDNGLRVIIREDHRNPIVVFSAFMATGSAAEGQYLGCGISHLAEHMLFKGTAKYPVGAIENILHKYGGMIDGFTSYDYTGFRITILKEHREIALDILKEMLTNPTFDKKELKKEKQVIEREMDLGEDNPEKKISNLTFSNAYIRHTYRIPVIGYKENFETLTRDDLVRFFNLNYTPQKLIIAIVGDIDKDTVFKEVEKVFGGIRRGRNTASVLPVEPPQRGERYIGKKMAVEGAYLNIAFHSTSLLNSDLYALDLLSFILGQGESSILNQEIRLKRQLVSSIGCYNYTPRDPGLFIISSVLKEGGVQEALDGILKELDSVKENGVSEADLTKGKNNFIASYIYQKETIESRADDLAMGELLTGNPGFFKTYTDRIRTVTLKEIRAVARKYLTDDNMTVVALSKSGGTLGRLSGLKTERKKSGREVMESKGAREQLFFFFFKQKTAYEIYQCDWSSDVCSSDLSVKRRMCSSTALTLGITSSPSTKIGRLERLRRARSEERRVGKECRSRWSPYH